MNKTISYLRYKRKHLWQFVDADGYYGYQCVDLIRHYCRECYNFNMGKLPSAKDANTKTTFPWWYTVKVGQEELKKWDIIILWPTPWNKHGHIAIIDKSDDTGVWIMEQNGSWKWSGQKIPWNEIRIRKIKRWNILNVFRFISKM